MYFKLTQKDLELSNAPLERAALRTFKKVSFDGDTLVTELGRFALLGSLTSPGRIALELIPDVVMDALTEDESEPEMSEEVSTPSKRSRTKSRKD